MLSTFHDVVNCYNVFIKVTLERAMKTLNSTEDSVFSAFESETLLMAMGLLSTIMIDEELVTCLFCIFSILKNFTILVEFILFVLTFYF